jgi:hypothetical protein
MEKYTHIYYLDRTKHPIITSDICHFLLCASLDILLQQLDLNTPVLSDIKNNENNLCTNLEDCTENKTSLWNEIIVKPISIVDYKIVNKY